MHRTKFTFGLLISGIIFGFAGTVSAEPFFDRSLRISSAESFLSVADATQQGLDISGDMTLECWFQLDSSESYFQFFKEDGGDPDSAPYGFTLQPNNESPQEDDFVARMINNADDTRNTEKDMSISIASLQVKKWNHGAWVFRAQGGVFEFVLNGQSMGQVSGMNTHMWNSTGSVVLGTNKSTPTSLSLRDCRIWGIAKAVSEVADNMNAVIHPQTFGLISDWPLKESLEDRTGRNHLVSNVPQSVKYYSHIGKYFTYKLHSDHRQNDVAPATDTELSVALDRPNATYHIRGVLIPSALNGTPDFRFALSAPSDASLKATYIAGTAHDRSTAGVLRMSMQESLRIRLIASSPAVIHIEGIIMTGASTGSLDVSWAQFVSSPTAVILEEGSYLSATPL